jgi:predicted acetyltransferase
MTVPQLADRMRGWLATDYEAMIFQDGDDVVAYALYRDEAEQIYLRQLFVVRDRRREGIGRQAVNILCDNVWPKNKRLLVEVLCHNKAAIEFWKAVGFREYSLALEITPENR